MFAVFSVGFIFPPPRLLHSFLPPFSVLLSLSLLAFLLVWVFEFARDSWLEGRKLLFWHLKRYLTADCYTSLQCLVWFNSLFTMVPSKPAGEAVLKPKPKPKRKPVKPYPKLPSAPIAPSGTLSVPIPFLHVLLPLPAPAPPAVPPPPQLARAPLPAALAPPPMPFPSTSSSSSSSPASASPDPFAPDPPSPLSFSGGLPPRIPPPITNTRIPFPRSHLPVQSLFGPGGQLEPVHRWAVIPSSDGLRLRSADAQLDSIQLSEQRLLPGAVDPGLVPALVPAAADPAVPMAVDPAVPAAIIQAAVGEESSETVFKSEAVGAVSECA